jgi:hypothetical protein
VERLREPSRHSSAARPCLDHEKPFGVHEQHEQASRRGRDVEPSRAARRGFGAPRRDHQRQYDDDFIVDAVVEEHAGIQRHQRAGRRAVEASAHDSPGKRPSEHPQGSQAHRLDRGSIAQAEPVQCVVDANEARM